MIHSTTPKRDKTRDHIARLNISIDELLSTRPVGNPWLIGGETDSAQTKLTKLYAQRDKAIAYMNKFRR